MFENESSSERESSFPTQISRRTLSIRERRMSLVRSVLHVQGECIAHVFIRIDIQSAQDIHVSPALVCDGKISSEREFPLVILLRESNLGS